jgi:cell wall-associated NlpC family hydrolase
VTVLSVRDIYQAALSAGFTPHQAVTWTSIALAESGGNTKALNNRGEYSVGLWQVNVRSSVRANKWGDLTDPRINAKAAYEISRGGRDIRPWTTTHDVNKGTQHDFRHYIDKVEHVVGVQGDHRGVHGYRSPMLKPLHYDKSYDQIDEGRSLVNAGQGDGTTAADIGTGASPPAVVTAADADHDGLTDAFERLAGTDPTRGDTDDDGLMDSYEAVVSHTDPLAADSDGDRISDPAEIAAHTDPGKLPGIAGVVGTGRFAENARHGVVDTDKDGLSDHTEKLVGTDPTLADTDSDTLSDAEEASIGTNPTLADTDGDGLSDGLEISYGSDPLGGTGMGGSTGGTAPWTLDGAADQLAGQPDQASAAAAQGTSGAGAMAAGGALNQTNATSALHTFLTAAKAQEDDPYVYGARRTPTAKNPRSFDCSSLTQWAARQAGVKIASTAEYQYMEMKQHHRLISVDEALRTPGALLFYFSVEPTAGLPPGQAHVAISKGDGTTIEARNTAMGIGEWSAKHRFRWAGVLPGISDAKGQQEYRAYLAARQGLAGQDSAAATDSPTDHSSAAAFDIDGGTPLGYAGTSHVASGLNGDPTGQQQVTSTTGPDADQDGLTDAFERLIGTSFTLADTDGDKLSDAEEISIGTNPTLEDTDRDGLSDGVEIEYHSDPLDSASGFGAGLGAGASPGGGADPAGGSLLPVGGPGTGGAADALDHG